jgi:AcrR family transcriptional regulator
MARKINEQDYAIRRNEILDVAQRLIYTRGYEQMSIQDILNELQMSKGAFYHYFDSKQALLEAMIERTRQEGERILVKIVEDDTRPAPAKLQHFFDTMSRWKAAQKAYVLALLRIWYADDNALVRQKVQSTMLKHSAPWLTRIIRQGIAEGSFRTAFPEQVATMIFVLFQGLGDQFVELLLTLDISVEERMRRAEELIAAYTHMLELALQLPDGSLVLMDAATIREWFGPASGQEL